jgi:N-acyl homoserine lactone hydrolase
VQGHGALPDDQELALARREDGDVAISKDDIRRVPLGHYTRPTGDPLAGQRIVVSAFLVPHPGGTVLFDTGIGEGEPEFDRHYRVVRRELREGLAALGVGLDEIRLVANCHLHADHCGGNPTLADRTVFVQRAELAAARTPDYTIPGLVDFMGATYEELDGEAEILPGVRVVPTPGHTDGHQSLVVDCPEGPVGLLGQAYPVASDWARAALAWSLANEGVEAPLVANPAWVGQLQELDPCRVLLAHDLASVERAPF